MNMAKYRVDRTSEDIIREISAIMRELNDPRVKDKILSIVHAEVSNDLSYAKINISALDGFDASVQAVNGLTAATGYIRRELGKRFKLRIVPELRFIADNSIEHGAEITRHLDKLAEEERTK